MAYYYDSQDAKKGEVLDALAREYLGKYDDPSSGNVVLKRIAAIFPSIERMLRGELLEEHEEAFKSAAKNLYTLINQANLPASLVAAFAETPDFRPKGLKALIENLLSTSMHTQLRMKDLHAPLETLVKATGSFAAVDEVVSHYNQLFPQANQIPAFTETVAELSSSGLPIPNIADLASDLYRGGTKEVDGKVLQKLIASLPKLDYAVLRREMALLADSGSMEASGDEKIGYYKIEDVNIQHPAVPARLLLSSEGDDLGLWSAEQRKFGLYVALVGALALSHELSAESSGANIVQRKLDAGTYAVFNRLGGGTILAQLSAEDDIRVEGLAKEELHRIVLRLQEMGQYFSASYQGIAALGRFSEGRKHLATEHEKKKSAVQFDAPDVTCVLSGIDLQKSTIEEAILDVTTEDRGGLYNELVKISPSVDVPFEAIMTENGVKVRISPGAYPMASEKQGMQTILEVVDRYATRIMTPGKQAPLLDFLCYLNSHATSDRLPSLLSQEAKTLEGIGPLFLYPDTFETLFPKMHDVLQVAAIEVMFKLQPDPRLSEARQWLTRTYKEQIIGKGLDTF